MTTLMTRRLGGALLALALGLILPASALAEDFVVNSSADPGVDGVCDETECTLREAIVAANGNGESDTITFDLDEGDRVIRLVGTELTIADDMADPDLTIDGDLDGDGAPDITVNAEGSSRVFLIASGANATLEGLVITSGDAGLGGGGIFNSGMLTVANSTISDNSSDAIGGGISNEGTLTVTNSTITNNRTTGGGSGAIGGGIFNLGGTVTVSNSTISGNSVGASGGGIFNLGGTVTVANSTISGNTAGSTGGGGIYNQSATLTVTNSTISGNSALGPSGAGGGIHNQGLVSFPATAEIKSTVVAGNTATATTSADCHSEGGTLTSHGFNLEGGTSCGFTEDGDQQSVALADVLVTDANGDPLLADNGGPTQTIALLDADTNPALDAIPADDCTDISGMPVLFDQRGVARPQPFPDGDCDIGAFELVQAASVTIADVIELFDDAVADGTLSGAGPGNSAAGRLNALRNMLLAAGELLEQGDVDAACTQLQDAADRTDGASPPPDFVQGDAAGDLFEAIIDVQDELGCFA